MLKQIRPAIMMILLMTLITGLLYPLGLTGARPASFPAPGRWQPDRAERQGDRLRTDRPEFHQRQIFPWPSLGRRAMGYDAANSSGSNLGPTSKKPDRPHRGRRRQAAGRKSRPRRCRSIWSRPRPAASIPTSRPAAALFQVPRVAKARGLSPSRRVGQLVGSHIEGRLFGLIGEPHVNVLKLNMALDAMQVRRRLSYP